MKVSEMQWSNPASKSNGYVAVFSRVDDLEFKVVVASRQRMSGLGETNVNDAFTSTHVL